MTISFDNETIRLITLFENITGAPVKDCLVDDKTIYYVVEKGTVGMAIGKEGSSVKSAEKIIGKSIKVFEFSSDVSEFVRKLIPQALEISIKNQSEKTIVEVKVEKQAKAIIIGREGKNLKILKEIIQRCSNVDNVLVK